MGCTLYLNLGVDLWKKREDERELLCIWKIFPKHIDVVFLHLGQRDSNET